MEVKRRRGRGPDKDSAGRPLPKVGEVVPLRMADGVPPLPVDVQTDGARLWYRIWDAGITWISPQSDMEAAEQACRLVDDVADARRRYRATTDPKDAQALVALNKELTVALANLGFTPTARSRLGVAEVQRVSALDSLLANRQKRSTS